jgi:hypothetical protein
LQKHQRELYDFINQTIKQTWSRLNR